MDGNKTERLAVSPFPHDARRVVAGIGYRADTPQGIESTLSDAYMDMRFGAPDPVWPEGAPFIHAETAIVRQRHAWREIVRAHQREMSGSSIDSHDRRLLNSLRRARAEADLACTMVAIATQEISDNLKRFDQELAKLPPPPPEAAEIRTYIRTTLQDGRARERFIEVAPPDGDLDTVSAALPPAHT